MRNKQFYPSYIPGKWIHYAHHKKKRIRKKYQNRILRYIRQHEHDTETSLFLLHNAQRHLGMSTQELLEAAEGVGQLFASVPPLHIDGVLVPRVLELEVPPILPEIPPNEFEELNKVLRRLRESIVEVLRPIVDAFAKLVHKFWKWACDIADHFWCNNHRWWYMAEHHKKYRIRKKYRNKIKRAARERAREALPELLEAIRSDDSEATSDDEEGP